MPPPLHLCRPRTPPLAVARSARLGLLLHARGFAGGTEAGLRRARQLAAGRPVGPTDQRVMWAWFRRHGPDASNGGTSFPGYVRAMRAYAADRSAAKRRRGSAWRGAVAWFLWGGDAGYAWIMGCEPGRETARAAPTRRRLAGGTELCPRGKEAAMAKFAVYPSAYANGYAVQVCRGTKPDADGRVAASPGWGHTRRGPDGGLGRWFRERWMDVCTGEPCGRRAAPSGTTNRTYPYCRPSVRVDERTPAVLASDLDADEIRKLCGQKRAAPGRRVTARRRSRASRHG